MSDGHAFGVIALLMTAFPVTLPDLELLLEAQLR